MGRVWGLGFRVYKGLEVRIFRVKRLGASACRAVRSSLGKLGSKATNEKPRPQPENLKGFRAQGFWV